MNSIGLLFPLLMIVVGAVPDSGASQQTAAIPTSADIKQLVSRHFEAKEDYLPDDLILREDVKPLLEKLHKQGLPLPDAQKILDDVPRKDEFLAQQFDTPNGQKFMRGISRYPMAYDRLDRLSRLPRGRGIVQELIRGPGGEKMIEYMTTASGGKELGKMLSNSPGAGDFNAPTGRIYTAAMLLKRLEQSRRESIEAAEKKPRR